MFIFWGWEPEVLLTSISLDWGSSQNDAVIQSHKAWADLVSGAPFPDPSPADLWTCIAVAKPYLFVWFILISSSYDLFLFKKMATYLDSKIILVLY